MVLLQRQHDVVDDFDFAAFDVEDFLVDDVILEQQHSLRVARQGISGRGRVEDQRFVGEGVNVLPGDEPTRPAERPADHHVGDLGDEVFVDDDQVAQGADLFILEQHGLVEQIAEVQQLLGVGLIVGGGLHDAPALMTGREDELEDHQADEQKQVKPKPQQAELDQGRHLDLRFGVSAVDFTDLSEQARDHGWPP